MKNRSRQQNSRVGQLRCAGMAVVPCALVLACGPAGDAGAAHESTAQSHGAVTVDCTPVTSDAPWDIKRMMGVAKDAAAIYTSSNFLGRVGAAVTTVTDILNSGPSTQAQLDTLKAELDCVAQGLDWKMIALAYNDSQWAPVSAAWMEAHEVGFGRGSDYDTTAHDGVDAAGGLPMFERTWVEASTNGPTSTPQGGGLTAWKSVISNHEPNIIDTDQVFDWRLAFPWFTQLIAMRMTMIAMMDPNFATDGLWNDELDGTDAVPGYKRMLQSRLQQMKDGIRCGYADHIDWYSGYNGTDVACADVNTGVNAVVSNWVDPGFNQCDDDSGCIGNLSATETVPIQDGLRRQVLGQMPVFEVQSLIDTLDRYTHPGAELTQSQQRIPVTARPDLCLDTQGQSTAAGTGVTLYPCDSAPSQAWVYDRYAQSIVNGPSGQCLGLPGGTTAPFGQPFGYCDGSPWDSNTHTFPNSNCTNSVLGSAMAPQAAPVLMACDGTDPSQHWTYGPEDNVITNELGNVLDIPYGSLTPNNPVWTWPLNGYPSQQWWADNPFTYQPPPQSSCGWLAPGEGLTANAGAWSCDGRFVLGNHLLMEGQLNLEQMITFDPPPPPPAPGGTSVSLWSAGSFYNFNGTVVMQSDGNLVVYDSGSDPVWSTNTAGHPGAGLAIQNDGNLVIYDVDGTVLWASNTCCR